MRDLKVIQVFIRDNKIMGLSEAGHLCHFNDTIGKWERRSTPEILEPGQSQKLMCHIEQANNGEVEKHKLSWKELAISLSLAALLVTIVFKILSRF